MNTEIRKDGWYGLPAVKPLIHHYTDFRFVCDVYEKSCFVTYKDVMYTLTDNGGEITVVKVNSGYIGKAPTQWFCVALDGHTLIDRLIHIFEGEPIDYAYRATDMMIEVLKGEVK
jgi:hypothetical protein